MAGIATILALECAFLLLLLLYVGNMLSPWFADGREDAVVKAFAKEEVAALKKRRFIEQTSFTFHRISRGPRFTPEWASQADDLTAQHIARWDTHH